MKRNANSSVEILAPTFFEYLLTRSVRPGVRTRHVGMRLARSANGLHDNMVILCGLAGGLSADLHPGDVVIPDECSFEGDAVKSVDATLVAALRTAARSLGHAPHGGRLLTASTMVTGDDRAIWADQGFVAADMEAALLPEETRFAVVRVILDAPDRSIGADWTSPTHAIINKQRWREMVWMARYAPVFARRAAAIAAMAARQFATSNVP